MTNKRYLLDTNILIDFVKDTHGEEYAHIKYALRKKGKPVDEFDMLIAAHAIAEGLIIVTDNLKHFQNMPDVKVENWMKR